MNSECQPKEKGSSVVRRYSSEYFCIICQTAAGWTDYCRGGYTIMEIPAARQLPCWIHSSQAQRKTLALSPCCGFFGRLDKHPRTLLSKHPPPTPTPPGRKPRADFQAFLQSLSPHGLNKNIFAKKIGVWALLSLSDYQIWWDVMRTEGIIVFCRISGRSARFSAV